MSTQLSTIEFITEQIAAAGSITTRKMFGEYCLYCDGKVVALVCDDQLFMKPTEGGRKFIKETVEKPAYPGAKPYFWISGEYWDDADWMSELIKISASELPIAKRKVRASKIS